MGKFIYNLFISIDQFGNALAFGNPDNTISARVGYFTHKNGKNMKTLVGKRYWQFLRAVIDSTFYPIDGKGHCLQAYYSNAGHEYPSAGSRFMLYVLSFLIFLSCFVLFPLVWIFGSLYRLFYPRNVKLEDAMMENFLGAIRKLEGIDYELQDIKDAEDPDNPNDFDPKFEGLADSLVVIARKLRMDISSIDAEQTY